MSHKTNKTLEDTHSVPKARRKAIPMDSPFHTSALVDTPDPVDIAAFGNSPTLEELEQRKQKYIQDCKKPIKTPWGTFKRYLPEQKEKRSTHE